MRPCHLILDGSWAALSAQLARSIAAARTEAQANDRLVVAVPSQIARHWLLKELARQLDNDLAGVDVITIHQLAIESFRWLKRDAPDVTEDKRYLACCWKLIQERPAFHYPKRDPYPTCAALYSVVRELRDAGVTPEEAEWLLTNEPYENLPPRAGARGRDVFGLYHDYTQTLNENGWTDGPQMMLEAAMAISENAAGGRGDAPGALFIWGFYEFTGVQKLFLKAAGGLCAVTVFLPQDAFTQPMADEFIGWGFKAAENTRPRDAAGHADILRCASPQEEALTAARLIKGWVQEGHALASCAVIYRDTAAYFPILEKILLEEGIPFVAPEDPRETLAQKPLGAVLKAALRFWERPGASRALDILERPMNGIAPELRPHTAAALARLLSLSPAQRSLLIAQKTAAGAVEQLVEWEPDCPKTLKGKVAQETLRWFELLWEGADLSRQATPAALAAWLDKIAVKPAAPALKQALEKFREILEAFPATLLNARAIAVELMEEAMAGVILDSARTPERANGVWLLSANQARGGCWPNVIILGAVDGAYPMDPRDNPFLPDILRRRLNELGFGLKETKRDRRFKARRLKESVLETAEDALIFKLLQSSAGRACVITYPQVMTDGKPALPSPYLDLQAPPGEPGPKKLPTAPGNGSARQQTATIPEPSAAAVVRLDKNDWNDWLSKRKRLSPTALSDFLSCPQAFAFKQIKRLPGLPPPPRAEFFPAVFLGEAFARTLYNAFGGPKKAPWKLLWNEELGRAFGAIDRSQLAPAERYKMNRIESLLELLNAEWAKLAPAMPAKTLEREKTLALTGGNGRVMSFECRADLALGEDTFVEIKLKRRSAFGDTTGARTKALGMLEKLMSPGSPEGPRYGLQILFYLLHAQEKNPSSGQVLLINAYWEVAANKAPLVFGWKTAENLAPQRERLSRWLNLFEAGVAADAETVLFPFWPHEKFAERCSYCPHQSLCLKDVPAARRIHEELTQPLSASFALENDDDE
ncbi:MAG: PD-(D/E)XK nuclease family protein [Elusimicrobia bacterium]|nr:PD-(D/E)XK nuclease family protein [Elusimicrobiota bacterium]